MTAELSEDDVTVEQVAKMIDHSLLRPELTPLEVREGCELAARYEVASVCVKPADVALATAALAGTGVLVGTVVAFPHGGSSTRVKCVEASVAIEEGGRELDMVLNIGWLRQDRLDDVADDIAQVVSTAAGAAIVKVVLENAYLTDEQKVRGCQVAESAGADFVKTSTGFAPGGATMGDVALMRASVSPRVGIKAAGGVRTLDVLLAMASVGVTRFGATATAAIIDDLRQRRG